MAEVLRPDYTYQWSSGGAIVAPSNAKIQTGWTAEVPPFQWENWSQNRQDNAIVHLLQKGISLWSSTQDYYFTVNGPRAYVQGSDGNIYVALQNSTGQNPTTDINDTYWKLAFSPAERTGTEGGTSFRNIIHNGNFNINQRGYISGTNTTSTNQFTLDRWKVQTLGQNLVFVGSGNGNAITAPAGGLAQVIEGVNISGGTYCISWVGAGTATINGSAVSKGGNFNLPANTNATVVVTGAVSQLQIERGTLPTSFEFRPFSTELALCQRYCQVTTVTGNQKVFGWGAVLSSTQVAQITVYLPVILRATPTVNNIGGTTISIFSTTTSVAGTPTTITYAGNILTFDATSATGNTVGAIAGYILSVGTILVLSSDL